MRVLLDMSTSSTRAWVDSLAGGYSGRMQANVQTSEQVSKHNVGLSGKKCGQIVLHAGALFRGNFGGHAIYGKYDAVNFETF